MSAESCPHSIRHYFRDAPARCIDCGATLDEYLPVFPFDHPIPESPYAPPSREAWGFESDDVPVVRGQIRGVA